MIVFRQCPRVTASDTALTLDCDKKELKENIGKPLRYVETSVFGQEYKPNGTFCVVGPDAYNNRKWCAKVMEG